MMDLQEVFPHLFRISLHDQTLHIGRTIRIIKEIMTNAQTSHLLESMETDLEMNLSTIRMETGETMETSRVLHRLQGETSPKISHTADQEVINPTTLLSADLTIDPRLVSRLTNKSSGKTIIRLHLMWFASSQTTKTITNYQTSVRQTVNVSELKHRPIPNVKF